jgi:hypothetical protein
VTAGQMPARATLRLGWPVGPVIVTWLPGPDGEGWKHARSAGPAVEGELLIACLHRADPFLLETADVICCPAGRDSSTAVALERVLNRCPGAAVAAAPCGGRRCRVATRTGHPFAITVAGPAAAGARATLLGAAFVHGWLTAGCPAVLLESAELAAGVSESLPLRSVAGDGATPVPFDMSFEFNRK